MIKEKYIDAIKSRVDICQLVMDLCPGTKLLKAGQNRKKCCCVFHGDKSPSLMLDTALNRYKCFGCGKGGDVITFVEDFKGFNFVDAVKITIHCIFDFICNSFCMSFDKPFHLSKGIILCYGEKGNQYHHLILQLPTYAFSLFAQ